MWEQKCQGTWILFPHWHLHIFPLRNLVDGSTERSLVKDRRRDSPRKQSKWEEFGQENQGTKTTRKCWISHRFLYDKMMSDLPMASITNTFWLVLVKERHTQRIFQLWKKLLLWVVEQEFKNRILKSCPPRSISYWVMLVIPLTLLMSHLQLAMLLLEWPSLKILREYCKIVHREWGKSWELI